MAFSNLVTLGLDRRDVPYRLLTYESHGEPLSAVDAAHSLDRPAEQVYKTLIAINPAVRNGYAVCILPGPAQLDLKRVARHLKAKKCQLAPRARTAAWTGMQPGGISPFGLMAKRVPFLLDASVREQTRIVLSAGAIGNLLEISTQDTIRLLKPEILKITR